MNKRTNTKKTSKYNHNRLTMLGKECGLLHGEFDNNKVEPIQTTKKYKYKKKQTNKYKNKKPNAKKTKTRKYNHNRPTMLGKECGWLDGEHYNNRALPTVT